MLVWSNGFASTQTAAGYVHPIAKQDTSSPTMRHHHRYHDVPWQQTWAGKLEAPILHGFSHIAWLILAWKNLLGTFSNVNRALVSYAVVSVIVATKIKGVWICLAVRARALKHCGGKSLFGTSSRPQWRRLGSQLHPAPCELDENLSFSSEVVANVAFKRRPLVVSHTAQWRLLMLLVFESSFKGSNPLLLWSFVIALNACRDGNALAVWGSPGTLLHQQKCCWHLWRCLKLFEKGSTPLHRALVGFLGPCQKVLVLE